MTTQEETDDSYMLLYEHFTENADKVKLKIPRNIPTAFLKINLVAVNMNYTNVHEIMFYSNDSSKDSSYILSFKVSDPIINTRQIPDDREIQWAENTAKHLHDFFQNQTPENKFYRIEPFISDPEGLRSSCLEINPQYPRTTHDIIAALFRRHNIVRNPRLITVQKTNSQKEYFIKADVSCKINTGYGDTPLNPEKKAIVKEITEKALQKIKRLEKKEKKKGKKL